MRSTTTTISAPVARCFCSTAAPGDACASQFEFKRTTTTISDHTANVWQALTLFAQYRSPLPHRYTFCESGIVSHHPRACGGTATFREALEVGAFGGGKGDVNKIVASLRSDWAPGSYVVVGKNCNDFSAALCADLGVGGLPAWINRAATWGAVCVGTSGLTAPVVPDSAALADDDASAAAAPPPPRAAPRAKTAKQQALLDKLKAAQSKS